MITKEMLRLNELAEQKIKEFMQGREWVLIPFNELEYKKENKE